MPLYLNEEGVILEHSAIYHHAGLRFIGLLLRCLAALQVEIPDSWKRRYEKAAQFYNELRRPDGTLPIFGDSYEMPANPVDLVSFEHETAEVASYTALRPTRNHSYYPVAGHAVWWQGLESWPLSEGISQTLVTWSSFPGHAHPHADELSLSIWADGQTWVTNTGYWPGGRKGRSEAISWQGSNAPSGISRSGLM